MIESFERARRQLVDVLAGLPPEGFEALAAAARYAANRLSEGGGVYFLGNGGSAAEAEHLAAELVGRFRRERPALRAVALSSSSPMITALANDFGSEDLFVRPVQAMLEPGDLLVALSTSGRSPNILRALDEASRIGAKRLVLTGAHSLDVDPRCEWSFSVASSSVERIQETHLLLGHLFCGAIEDQLSTASSSPASTGERAP